MFRKKREHELPLRRWQHTHLYRLPADPCSCQQCHTLLARMAKLKEEALANQEKLRVASELDRANTLELALEGGTRDLGVHTRTWFGICCRGGHRGMLVGQHR